jgi:hypothetical protein
LITNAGRDDNDILISVLEGVLRNLKEKE